MTVKQTLWKLVYPLTIFFTRNSWRGTISSNTDNKLPTAPFHALTAVSNAGEQINFSQFKGKKLLITNTASYCAYTSQYNDLQELQSRFADSLAIIAFPANDFNQETDNDETIREFCAGKFKIRFPLMKKTTVIKSPQQNPVFLWLSNAQLNGWNDKAPDWNFCKYLVDENGILTHYFGTSISPLDKAVLKAIKTNRASA